MAYAFLLIIAAALPKSLGLKITAEEEQTSGNLLWTCFCFLHQSFALVNNLIIPIVYIICWIAETSEESTDPLSIAELYGKYAASSYNERCQNLDPQLG